MTTLFVFSVNYGVTASRLQHNFNVDSYHRLGSSAPLFKDCILLPHLSPHFRTVVVSGVNCSVFTKEAVATEP
jgi:hypothetical protein